MRYRWVYEWTRDGDTEITPSMGLRYFLRTYEVAIDSFANSLHPQIKFTHHDDTQLRKLVIRGLKFTAEIISVLQPLLSRTHDLTLHECWSEQDSALSELFSVCSKLLVLGISNSQNNGLKIPKGIAMPRLMWFNIKGAVSSQYESIENFLQMIPQLIAIEMESCGDLRSPIIRSIARYNPQIKRLSFTSETDGDDFSEILEHLKQLRALKFLGIFCRFNRISPVIRELAQASIPMECLHLISFRCDESLVRGIVDLKNLKELTLIPAAAMKMRDVLEIVANLSELIRLHLRISNNDSDFNGNDLLAIIRCLPKLGHFYFDGAFRDVWNFDANLYQNILDVVSSRADKCRLTLEFGKCTASVPNDVLLANEDLLEIVFEYLAD